MNSRAVRQAITFVGLATALTAALAACGSRPAALGESMPSRASLGDTTSANTATTSAVPAAAPHGVCARIADCHVVQLADVDGDGKKDQIGWRQLGKDAVQIRVETASGHLLTAHVDVRLWWGGGAWAGAAHVDQEPGDELLVGSQQGAHTPMYTMLTYRSERLVVERDPSSLGPLWLVDAGAGDDIGWWRHVLADGRIAMTQKVAVRVGESERFSGHDVTYAWTDHRWVRTTSRAVSYPSARAAAAIAGFHVRGLARFPGI